MRAFCGEEVLWECAATANPTPLALVVRCGNLFNRRTYRDRRGFIGYPAPIAVLLIPLTKCDDGKRYAMSAIVFSAVIAMLSVGCAVAADPDGVGTIIEDLQCELKVSRQSLPHDEFVRIHTRIVELVDKLRIDYPNDPLVSEHQPDRWNLLVLLGKRDEAMTETDEVLATTTDPKLRINGLFLKAVLDFEKIPDYSATVSLAESFVRQVPGGPSGERIALLRR
jgi:hypothetical protein